MNQSAYLRSLNTNGKRGASQPGYTGLLQHLSDLDGTVFALAKAANANPALQSEDIEKLLFTMDAIWDKGKGSL